MSGLRYICGRLIEGGRLMEGRLIEVRLYFEKFEINISRYLPYSNETFYIKALGYKEYFTAIDLGEC